MPNWCSNTLEIQFPNKEAKDSFKAALEDTSCRQDNTVRKAVHILVLSMLGRYQPNRPIHGLETSEKLTREVGVLCSSGRIDSENDCLHAICKIAYRKPSDYRGNK